MSLIFPAVLARGQDRLGKAKELGLRVSAQRRMLVMGGPTAWQ